MSDNEIKTRPGQTLVDSVTKIARNTTAENLKPVAGLLSHLQQQLKQLSDTQKKTLDAVTTRLASLQGQLTQAVTKLQQLDYQSKQQQEQLAAVIQQMKILENISRENHRLEEEHYREHIVRPMANSLFPVFDIITDRRRHQSNKDLFDKSSQQDIINMMESSLRQFLSTYQISPVRHKPGSKLQPKIMKTVKVIPTDNPEQDKQVAASLQAGFLYKQEVVLRNESVALYRYKSRNKFENK